MQFHTGEEGQGGMFGINKKLQGAVCLEINKKLQGAACLEINKKSYREQHVWK